MFSYGAMLGKSSWMMVAYRGLKVISIDKRLVNWLEKPAKLSVFVLSNNNFVGLKIYQPIKSQSVCNYKYKKHVASIQKFSLEKWNQIKKSLDPAYFSYD